MNRLTRRTRAVLLLAAAAAALAGGLAALRATAQEDNTSGLRGIPVIPISSIQIKNASKTVYNSGATNRTLTTETFRDMNYPNTGDVQIRYEAWRLDANLQRISPVYQQWGSVTLAANATSINNTFNYPVTATPVDITWPSGKYHIVAVTSSGSRTDTLTVAPGMLLFREDGRKRTITLKIAGDASLGVPSGNVLEYKLGVSKARDKSDKHPVRVILRAAALDSPETAPDQWTEQVIPGTTVTSRRPALRLQRDAQVQIVARFESPAMGEPVEVFVLVLGRHER